MRTWKIKKTIIKTKKDDEAMISSNQMWNNKT
jgi:hypothetical protein